MKNKTQFWKIGFLLAFIFAFAAGEAWSANITWTGGGANDNWTNTANWNTGTVPGAGDNVTINYLAGNTNVDLDADVTINNLTVTAVASGGTTDLNLLGFTLTCTGNVNVTGGAAGGDDATIDGTTDDSELIISGNLTITGVSGAGVALIDMTPTTARATVLTIAGNLSQADETQSQLDISGCDVTISGTMTRGATSNGTITTDTDTKITLNGSTQVTLDLAAAAVLDRLDVVKTGIGSVTQSNNITIDSLIITSGKYDKNAAGTLLISDYFYLADDASAEFDISGANAVTLAQVATFGDAGIVTTDASTPLVLGNGGTGASNITLPDDITDLASLVINRAAATSIITLSNDLTDAGVLTITVGKLVSGTNTITVGGAFSTANSANAIWDATGSSYVFNGGTHPVFGAASVITTTSSTNLTFNTTEAAGATLHASITALNNLTVNITATNAFNLSADLTCSGALTVTSGDLTPGANTVTVNGAFSMSTANATLDEGAGTLILNGPISIGNAANLDFDTGTFNLTIGGSGAITTITPTVATTLNDLTMNRAGETFNLEASGGFTIAGALTITNGTVDLLSNQTYGITGATVISAGGKLIRNAAAIVTFTGGISGAGEFDATTGAQLVFAAGCTYAYTGNFITDNTTRLTFQNDGATLQSSIEDLHTLVINAAAAGDEFNLSGDLTIANTFTPTQGTLNLNGSHLNVAANGYTQAANFTMDASTSTLEVTGATVLTNGTLTTNSSTNLIFNGAVTDYPPSADDINNLTFTTAAADAIDMETDDLDVTLTINGDLSIGAGYSFTSEADQNIIVHGTFSNAGTFVATANTPLYVYGDMFEDAAATWTTPENIDLYVVGTGSQLSLPAGITDLSTIVVNRPSGMKINATFPGTNGLNSAPCITLTSGDLDLNGYNITLGDVAASISENIAGGSTIINNGSDGAYITTATGASRTENIASGIGLVDIAGDDDAFEVRRYPKQKTIAGVNLSIARYYQILNQGAGPLTKVEFKYDNTELGDNSAGSLKLFYTKTADITEFMDETEIDSSTTQTNTPGTATGTLEATAFSTNIGAVNLFYALASPSGATGVVRVFNNSDGDNEWNNADNWNPSGVPTIDDDASIGAYTVYLTGNGSTYYCKSLTLDSPSAQLKPYTGATSGDTVKLIVNGNININYNGGNVDGVNSYGRLNLQIGDGNDPIQSTITPVQDYSPTAGGNGLSFHNLTINNAAVDYSGDFQIRTTGDISIEGTSVYEPTVATDGSLVLYGGYEATQSLDISSTSLLDLVNLVLDNAANVETSSNITIREEIKLSTRNDVFTSSSGLTTILPGAAVNGWDVFPGGTLKLWEVTIINNNDNNDVTPNGDIEIQGDFTYSSNDNNDGVGTDASFIPDDGIVKFSGTSEQILTNSASNRDQINFYHLTIGSNSSAKTSTDFSIRGDIDVELDASFVADNGTIYFPNTNPDPSYIKNASDHTLVFNNIDISDEVRTSDDWTVAGNMTISNAAAAILYADNGTISFDNDAQKTITKGAAGTLQFFNLTVTDGSKVTTATDLIIANNATNPTGAGIEVEGTGEFDATAGTITFDASLWGSASNPGTGNPKTITNSSNGTLEFFDIDIATNVNNDVSTASSFEITGDANAFVNNNAGLGGTFEATAGTVSFSSAGAVIQSQLPDATSFYNLKADNTDLTITDDHFINITGDLVVDGANGVFTATATGGTGVVKFNGAAQQNITGSSTQATPVDIQRLEINKTGSTTAAKEVVLQIDANITDAAASDIILNSGYLNLGQKTLTVGQGDIYYSHLAAINGAQGTYKIANTPSNVLMQDDLFTVDGTATLYNLTLEDAETLDGDLTINGALTLDNAAANDFTIGAFTLTLYGNMTRSTGELAGTGEFILTGTGQVTDFSDDYFNGGSIPFDIEIGRAETLGGDLTMGAKEFTLNTGINVMNLSNYTLDLTLATGVNRISGSLTAGINAKVIWSTPDTEIPANMFTNNQCGSLELTAAVTLKGDLEVTSILTGLVSITTGENVLTFGPNASIPLYNTTNHIIGNLERTVTSAGFVKFPIGDGTADTYRPVELQYASAGSSQEIIVSSQAVDPTYGRGGNPENAVDILWSFDPQGSAVDDQLNVKFGWASAAEGNGKAASIANATFPAKWENTEWDDYRNITYGVSDPRVLTMTGFPVENSNALDGDWAVFNADANTDAAKDDAISVSMNRVVITDISPDPVVSGSPFVVTVQLQDQYGQPIDVTTSFEVTITQDLGTTDLDATSLVGVIPAGASSVEITGFYTIPGGEAGHQLRADTTGGSTNWMPTVSNLFSVLGTEPATQATAITFHDVEASAMSVHWTANAGGDDVIVVAKADSLLVEGEEFPVDGTTYNADALFGSGSSLGDAVVVFKGTTPGNPVRIYGLAPNTTYYFYVFAYTSNNDGDENYKITPASQNPNLKATTGSNDDDASLGSNDTRANSKAIGTNTPVKGLIDDASDVDWYSFGITSNSPNMRVMLYDLPANYNVELYDLDGLRKRRSIIPGTDDDAFIINDLDPGTYTMKIYGYNGAFDADSPYTFKVTTKKSEIFSVTP